MTPGEELTSISPRIDAQPTTTTNQPNVPVFESPSQQFDALYTQSLALVASPTQILPFTTQTGYIHILRHLAPQTVYVSDLLAGVEGKSVAQLKGWVGQSVLVIGDDGTGGLADSDTEDEEAKGKGKAGSKWYEESKLVGLGKGLDVVDVARVGDDFAKRVVGGRG